MISLPLISPTGFTAFCENIPGILDVYGPVSSTCWHCCGCRTWAEKRESLSFRRLVGLGGSWWRIESLLLREFSLCLASTREDSAIPPSRWERESLVHNMGHSKNLSHIYLCWLGSGPSWALAMLFVVRKNRQEDRRSVLDGLKGI